VGNQQHLGTALAKPCGKCEPTILRAVPPHALGRDIGHHHLDDSLPPL
jgi:hypothetical protein